MTQYKLAALVAWMACSWSLTAKADAIINGTFDTWTGTSGATVISGTPGSWSASGTLPIEGPTLLPASGSGLSAVITNASGTGTNLTQSVSSSNLTHFVVSFDLALGRNTTAGAREFQMILGQGSNQVINFIMNGSGGSTGTATMLLHNGSGWQTLTDGTNAYTINDSGAYSSASNSFANSLNVYHFSIEVDWATAKYSISFTPDGGATTTISGLNYFFQTESTTSALSSISFFGVNSPSGGYYAIDNVSISSVPEPTAMAMMAGSLLLLGGRLMRRRD